MRRADFRKCKVVLCPLSPVRIAFSVVRRRGARPRQDRHPKTLTPLSDALDAFRTAQPAVRKIIDERVLSGAALEDLVGHLREEVRALDEDLKAFWLLDRQIYDGYVQMRKIISSGGGGGDTKAKPVVTLGA